MKPKKITDEVIFGFCNKILPQFNNIMKNLEEVRRTLSPGIFAMNLMDLGRGQMSEVDDPEEQEVELISRYVDALNLEHASESNFAAYAGGCIMGLVLINEVEREDLDKALSLIEEFARKEFNGDDDAAK